MMKSNKQNDLGQPALIEDSSQTTIRLQKGFWKLYVKNWLGNHVQAFIVGLGELVRAPIASIMTILVIGIAMAFPAGLYVLLRNFTTIGQQWNETPTISLYLQQGINPGQVSNLMALLQHRVEVQSLHYITPEQGLSQFVAETQLGDALKELPTNPLPGVIVITPKPAYQTEAALQNLLLIVKTLSGVEIARLDLAWIEKLHNLVILGKRIIYSLGVLLGLGVILIVGNTIRLATQNRRQEISVMQLVGATNAYIRRPFLYRGLFYGILGGLTAWVLIIILVMCLQQPGQQLVPYYARSLWSWRHTCGVGGVLILMSTWFSLLGSWIVVSHYLRKGVAQELYTLAVV